MRCALEQPFGRQTLLQLLEGELTGAEPLGLQVLASELVLALRVRNTVTRPRATTRSPSCGLNRRRLSADAEHHALDLRVRVLEREVHVPEVPHLAVRELALDPHFEELPLEQRADLCGELRDRQDATGGRYRWLRLGRRLGLGVGFFERQVEEGAHGWLRADACVSLPSLTSSPSE